MKKVLITGGAGFIGYFLAKKLLDFDYEIHLADNFSRGVNDNALIEIINSNQVKLINTNILDIQNLYDLDNDYHYIFHLAAIVGVKNVLKAPFDVLRNNNLLLNNMIDKAKQQKNLRRFIFASTSEVYAGTLKDFGIKFPTPEETPLSVGFKHDQRNTYMLSKIYGEYLCTHSGLPYTIIRPHNFYGPRMGLSHVIPEILKKAYESANGLIDVYNVDHKRAFCYITDAIDIIYDIIECEESLNEIFNIGNELDEVSMIDVASIIIKIVNNKLEVNSLIDNNNSPARRCPSMKKASKLINIRKLTSLEGGIANCNKWYYENVFKEKGISAL